MKHLLALEQLAQLGLALVLLYLQPIAIAWWAWPLLFLSPDLSMAGYGISPRVGAWTYNLAHHQGLALLLAATGWFLHGPLLCLAGLLLLAHSSFDRVLGYGLKHETGFQHTHLGLIGNRSRQPQA